MGYEVNDEQLKEQLAFDLYGRYALIRNIINRNREAGMKFKVLDVGGRGNIMRKFLPDDDVSYLDPFVDTTDDNYIEGDGCAIPASDGEFDWVVSADVFEHIPFEKRQVFLRENTRVAGKGVILAAPFHSAEAAQAEINANENYKVLIGGRDHQWLIEHITNGLPKEEEVERFVRDQKLSFQKLHNNNLLLWEILIGISFFVDDFMQWKENSGFKKSVQEFNRYYNTEVFPSDTAAPAYRTIYFIKKSDGLANLELEKEGIGGPLFSKAATKGFGVLAGVNAAKNKTIEMLKANANRMESEIVELEKAVQLKHQEIRDMRSSLRWKIPNFFYELYKEKIKKMIPRSILKATAPLSKAIYAVKGKRFYQPLGNAAEIEALDFGKLRPIEFKKEAQPLVSIVIPVFNKWKYTYHCLKYLSQKVGNISYEVVVVDNGSSDETEALFKEGGPVKNTVYIRNKENLGFIGGCNGGADASRGEYIVFLNNDTQILKNWLEALLKTFEEHKDAGLVGSKLIYPDGRLQESGGIVWKTRHVWNYGRLADPDSYEFNYLKEVDYCSAASVMIRTELFRKLDGFDKLYMPAYFEDTDLAFRVRREGYKVYYQPQSELVHFEGITAGTDVKKGLKQYQEINKEKFFARWKDVLANEGLDDSADGPFLARDRSQTKKRTILFVEHAIPAHNRDAGSFIVFEYLKILVELDCKVIFWPQNLAKFSPYAEELQQMGIEVVYGRRSEISFEKFIAQNGRFIDVSIISRPEVAQEFLPLIKRHTKSKVMYLAQDLHFLRKERELKFGKKTKERKEDVRKIKTAEAAIMKESDCTLLYSDAEVAILKKEFPEIKAEVIPWVQKVGENRGAGFADRANLLFVGSSHPPNIDGILWFHREVFPKIKEKIPNVIVDVCGNLASDDIVKLTAPDFRVVGFVDDIAPYFNNARVFIAPLRYGAGFKGKNAMAMGYSVPVVTTTIGSEGMGLTDGETVLIGDDAEAFAEAVVRLYTDKELWEKISANSLEHVRKNYSAERAHKRIEEILEN